MRVGITRNAVFAMMATILGLLIAEAMATVFIHAYGDRLPLPDPERFVASPEEAQKVHRVFDADIGWVTPYPTPYGERPRARDFGRPLIGLFGDSFTHADEVQNDEAWAETLASILTADVFNFGAGAYGIDQAVLRFERESKRRPTSLVILSFVGIDLDRCLGSFWKFQHPIGHFPLTKPHFRLNADRLQLHPNPVDTSEALAQATQDPAFIEKIGRHDPFYNPHGLAPMRPPYLLALARPSLWRALFSEAPALAPWTDPSYIRLAELLLLRFARGAESRGMMPFIMHLPQSSEVHALADKGLVPDAVHHFERICAQHELQCLTPIRDAAASVKDLAALYTKGRKGGHLSIEGNRWLAHYVAGQLREVAAAVLEDEAMRQ